MSEHPENAWHLDKRIPVALVVTLIERTDDGPVERSDELIASRGLSRQAEVTNARAAR